MKGLLIGLLLVSPCVLAGWIELSDGEIKSSVGDNKVIKLDDVIIFWQRVGIKNKDSPIDQLLMRVAISCQSNQYAVLHKSSYKKDTEIFKDDNPEQTKPIKEGSLLYNSAKYLCAPDSHQLILDSELAGDVY